MELGLLIKVCCVEKMSRPLEQTRSEEEVYVPRICLTLDTTDQFQAIKMPASPLLSQVKPALKLNGESMSDLSGGLQPESESSEEGSFELDFTELDEPKLLDTKHRVKADGRYDRKAEGDYHPKLGTNEIQIKEDGFYDSSSEDAGEMQWNKVRQRFWTSDAKVVLKKNNSSNSLTVFPKAVGSPKYINGRLLEGNRSSLDGELSRSHSMKSTLQVQLVQDNNPENRKLSLPRNMFSNYRTYPTAPEMFPKTINSVVELMDKKHKREDHHLPKAAPLHVKNIISKFEKSKNITIKSSNNQENKNQKPKFSSQLFIQTNVPSAVSKDVIPAPEKNIDKLSPPNTGCPFSGQKTFGKPVLLGQNLPNTHYVCPGHKEKTRRKNVLEKIWFPQLSRWLLARQPQNVHKIQIDGITGLQTYFSYLKKKVGRFELYQSRGMIICYV